MSQRTLLGVWAHPDDEAYLSAGLMAEFRNRGDRVVVVTATLGEHGTNDPERWPPHLLADLREVELRNALRAVGVDELRLLGYEDGTLDSFDDTDGCELLAEHILDVDPDVIVTFGPEGMTGHPDHKAISRWTAGAWVDAQCESELWYATLTPGFHRRWGALNDEAGLWSDQPEPPCTELDGLVRTSSLLDNLLDQKISALEAHESQTRPLINLVGRPLFREWWRMESFRRVDPALVSRASNAA
jgi:LmbE family N-acetylglucosaminyl deacetylase